MLLHYLEKLKIQFVCRYSADMEENTNKLHFECTDEYPSPVISYRRYCGSAACPFDSRLNDDCLNVFKSVRALRCLLLPGHLSTVPMSRNFFNSLLTPRFVQLFSGNSSVNFFAMYPFKYKLFIKILSLSLNTMLIVDKHCSDVCCDEFLVPQIDRKSKQVKEQLHEKFHLQSVWGKTWYFKHGKYQNLWMNNKVRVD